ncbi:MAG: IclR family transcriptional regulator, partial [Tissierellia bacterium]|nr:IclR family transcriptional regulator [Tissierellia bacterium]
MTAKIQSIERAFHILEAFKNYEDGAGLLEISESTELHKSTTHRILQTLISLGYVEQLENSKYNLTYKLFELGSHKLKNSNLSNISNRHLKRLSQEINEVVHLVIREGIEVVYIKKFDADNSITMASHVGMKRPMVRTAVGKSILSHLNDEEIQTIYQKTLDTYHFDHLLPLPSLMDQIRETRQTKLSFDLEENEDGVSCVATPILGNQGQCLGAISISGPAFRMKEKKTPKLYEKLVQAAKNISDELKY